MIAMCMQSHNYTVLLSLLSVTRCKRQYAEVDIAGLLQEKHHITSSVLMPVSSTTSYSLINDKNSPSPTFPSFLPLEIFDDTEYDCRTPHEWIELGKCYSIHVVHLYMH